MANTYSQIYIQIVFVVKGRQNLIVEGIREELQKYITGIISNQGAKMLCIYCMPDHTHLFIELKPQVSISELVKEVKRSATLFINEKKLIKDHFEWQSGFGAFSYSYSQVKRVAAYIENQKQHHAKKSFKDEYTEYLRQREIAYQDQYLFEWL